MKYYSIQVVSQMCGLSTHCIRAWEKRYGAIRPSRSENGRRVYSEAELNRLMMLGKLCSFGNSISLIANLSDQELSELLTKMSKGKVSSQVTTSTSILEPQVYLSNLFMALNAYKLDILTHELNKASMDLSCRDFALEVVAALFRKVGEYVHNGRMSIAQENALSAITKFFIGRRIAQHYRSDQNPKFKITLATPKGEHHTIGLLLSCLLMVEHDVSFLYLGEDLPIESIVDTAKATNSNAVLVSLSPAYRNGNISPNELCLEIRNQLPENIELWMGGAVKEISSLNKLPGKLTLFSRIEELENKLKSLSDS